MSENIAIGIQDFSTLIENHYFYVDKTDFIKEWWDCGDSVTLITRPRRFGKTLTMSMVEQFFSVEYSGRSDLFEDLKIWEDKKYRNIQGTYPVISLSFANVKEPTYQLAEKKICELIAQLYVKYDFITESGKLRDTEVKLYKKIMTDMEYVDATLSLYYLSGFLYKYYGKKVIILLDEYDTPMQEAFVDGYWEQLVTFTRSLFNATFKTNPALERGIMTGITRVSKESIFSDLNNLKVVTTTSNEYAASFGFTEQEVFSALESFGLENEKNEVKRWYDGFIFGTHKDIYNPWSILNYLDAKQYTTYWANTSANSLVGKLVREGNRLIKEKFEKLLESENVEEVPAGNDADHFILNIAHNEKAKILSNDKFRDYAAEFKNINSMRIPFVIENGRVTFGKPKSPKKDKNILQHISDEIIKELNFKRWEVYTGKEGLEISPLNIAKQAIIRIDNDNDTSSKLEKVFSKIPMFNKIVDMVDDVEVAAPYVIFVLVHPKDYKLAVKNAGNISVTVADRLRLEKKPLIAVRNDLFTRPGTFELNIMLADEVTEHAPYNVLVRVSTHDEVFIKKNSRNIASTIAGRLGSWKFPFVSVKPDMLLEKPGDFEIELEKGGSLDG